MAKYHLRKILYSTGITFYSHLYNNTFVFALTLGKNTEHPELKRTLNYRQFLKVLSKFASRILEILPDSL